MRSQRSRRSSGAQRKAMEAQNQLFRERISNALNFWKEDLGAEAAELERQFREL